MTWLGLVVVALLFSVPVWCLGFVEGRRFEHRQRMRLRSKPP